MTTAARPGADRFRYEGYDWDDGAGRLVCRYALGATRFVEALDVTSGAPGGPPGDPGAREAAARLVYLLAGVSYYKTAAPDLVDLGDTATTDAERAFLRAFYVEGLGEFAHRNGLDLRDLVVDGPRASGPRRPPARPEGPPLVPFGGGIDSIVTAEAVRAHHPGTALFVVSRAGDRFAAIERPAAATGLPVVRAERRIDPSLLRSAALGYLNGHVPVTGILSAVAVLAAVTGGYGAVVMSNEHSASAATLEVAGRPVNHQWSKGAAFERAFRGLLAATFDPAPEYFSLLRARSELWVAERFAALTRYHPVFRSCNRAFALDPARRLDRWCAECDKCCFIDLVLAPFLGPDALEAVFAGREPLRNEALVPQFRALVATGGEPRPFECVGDVEECRTAVLAAAARPDRAADAVLGRLAGEVRAAGGAAGPPEAALDRLRTPLGEDWVPAGFSPEPAGAGART